MNKVILVGRLVKDPELRKTNADIPVVQFAIAVNRTYSRNGERQADFINCVAWRNLAENLAKFMRKGNQIGIEGQLQVRNYEDANGAKRYVTEVVADNVRFLESKAQSEARNSSSGATPYDFQEPSNDISIDNDPFADFGDSVSIDDNFLD